MVLKMKFKFLLHFYLLSVVLVNYCFGKEYSWCDPDLCTDGSKHIACRSTGAFHWRCKRDSTEVDISKHKSEFVHEHNKRRNFIALGVLPGYYPARRMATMNGGALNRKLEVLHYADDMHMSALSDEQIYDKEIIKFGENCRQVWDDELQYLSSLNVRTCILDHDDCHNTYRFKNSGQNLCAIYRDRNPNVNVTNLIEESLSLWFNEYPLIDSSFIDSFKVTDIFEDYGHFAEMVVDRNTHVGCSIMRFTRPDYPWYYIYNVVCNYASIYALEAPVYDVGKAASRCTTGKNPFYPGLCSTREEFDPNY